MCPGSPLSAPHTRFAPIALCAPPAAEALARERPGAESRRTFPELGESASSKAGDLRPLKLFLFLYLLPYRLLLLSMFPVA